MKINKWMAYYSMVVIAISYLGFLKAQETHLDPSLCNKEELLTFFPFSVVRIVLINNHVAEEQAQIIAKELSVKQEEISRSVDQKTSQIDPNLFKDLDQRDKAIRIYNETLYDTFANVLRAHGINNERQIQKLSEEIRIMTSKWFFECLRKERSSN